MAEHALIGIATSAAKVLTQLVVARALDEINLNWGFRDQLRKLKEKFDYIQAFLDDAGTSKHAPKSQLLILWVQKVKDAAYLADNVMDEYTIEIFRRKMELKNTMKVLDNFCKPSNPVLFRIKMGHKVKQILSLFNEIDKEAKRIGVHQIDIAATSLNRPNNDDHHLSQTRQHAAAKGSEYIDREDDQEKLLDFICRPTNYDEPDLCTVAITGMGGVGKTTLTRHLYDHARICANFGSNKIWICVSQNFEIERLLNEMIESVTSSKSELSNIDAIIRKLQEELKEKKFLLVFDDVWNDNQDSWGSLKGYLNRIGACTGSVVLVNARSDAVAKAAGAVFQHKLEGLSTDKSWSLLHQIVSKNQSIDPSLKEVGTRIVEKCKGVPLVIKVIGGLLQSKHQLYEWELIEQSELWDSPHGQNQILPSLLLSFNNLPSSSAKQCFAYYSVFHKDSYVHKSELIGLWLSQGYLRNDTNLSMEEIGEENLKILLSNSLLEECEATQLGIVRYRMHYLVYDLATYVSGSDLIKRTKDLCEIDGCRHLVFNSVENKDTSDIPPEKALVKLRTLSLKGTDIQWNMLIHTRYLRTLKLDRTGIEELPPAVAMLKHLRFLDVSYNPISTLPDFIEKLYQLQTLILQDCINMKKLPKVVNKLPNLRHISTTAPMFAWKGLQQLTNLQNLPCLSLDNDAEGWTIDELGNLHDLKDEIHILGLECVKDKEQAIKVGLDRKLNVTKLNLSWSGEREEGNGGSGDEDILEGLEPHPNISSLEVQNFTGVRLPTWIAEMALLTKGPICKRTRLNNLTSVKLLNCNRCRTLPKLGQLPFLKSLIMSGLYVEFIGIEFYGGDDLNMMNVSSFKCLRELDITGFCRLTTWMDPPKEAFPHLESLRIRECRLLKSVPAFEFKSLTSLELENLYSVNSLDIIKYSSGLTSLVVKMLPEITSLPEELANRTKLQILNISDCDKLVSSPRCLKSPANLQSTISNVNLQSLPRLSLVDDREGWSIDELGPLKDEIHITGLECVKDKEQAREVGLALNTNVSSLTLSWAEGREENNDGISDEHVLEGLEPHPNIKTLELKNFIGARFPVWITRMAVLTQVPTNNWTRLNNLTTVKLLNCSRCGTLPKLGHLPLLKCLIMSGLYVELIGIEFYGGDDLDTSEVVSFKCLRELEISGFSKLAAWIEPPKEAFPHLETLRIRECVLLKSVPALGTRSLISLKLDKLHSLESLDIIKYSSGLTSLVINDLPKIDSLPQELANCEKLQILKVCHLIKLVSLPRRLESLVNLQSMEVQWCEALNFVMDDLLHVRSSLRNIAIVGCPSLRKIPSSLEECTSLDMLWIQKCPLAEGSPTHISKMQRLWNLRISCRSTEHLTSVLESAQYLPLLRSLALEGFGDEKEMSEYFSDMTPFLRLPCLTQLSLWGGPNIKTMPQQLGLLTRITHLCIGGFDDLEQNPDWICNLSSLVFLSLEYCENLKNPPSKQILSHLTYLRILKCPMLAERYKSDKDGISEWHSISHIKQIDFDDKMIQDLDEK